MHLTNFKIDNDFHHYKQAELDELIQEYLRDLSEDKGCEVIELTEIIGFKNLNFMIERLTWM